MNPASHQSDVKADYKANSITLGGAVAMGTGVMIGAGIFALTGQIAELAGPLFPLAFIAGAIVSGFSAYGYICMSNAWPARNTSVGSWRSHPRTVDMHAESSGELAYALEYTRRSSDMIEVDFSS